MKIDNVFNKYQEQWLAVLLYGEYKQGAHFLKQSVFNPEDESETEYFCCLGVQEDMERPEEIVLCGTFDENYYKATAINTATYDTEKQLCLYNDIASLQVDVYLNNKKIVFDSNDMSDYIYDCLTELNDSGLVTFKQIAQLCIDRPDIVFKNFDRGHVKTERPDFKKIYDEYMKSKVDTSSKDGV